MNICVFCSANDNIDKKYFDLTRRLGHWAADHGHTIVFGGCDKGLMECVALAARERGGRTIGVVPTIVEKGGHVSDNIDVCFPCNNLNDRKELLTEMSDVFIAMPGGIGTVDEIFTVAASASIGYHRKKLVLFNVDGFWNKLTAMIDDLQTRGFIRGDYTATIRVADTFEELTAFVSGLDKLP